jgi:hypothetical protein
VEVTLRKQELEPPKKKAVKKVSTKSRHADPADGFLALLKTGKL